MSAVAAGGAACLEGLRVLELADETGVYAGKLFADLGADVIKVERPGGDATRAIQPFHGDVPHPDRSLFFLYMNTNKRGITLDPAHPDGAALFAQLAARADIVLETRPPGWLDRHGIGFERLRAEHAGLILTSITGFGQTGPHRDHRSCDLVASAMGGAMTVIGEAQDPPVVQAGSQCDLMAATTAAVSSLIALHHRRATGEGQHVDISTQETTLAVSHISGVGKWLDDGIVPVRRGAGLFASVPSGTYRCSDGLVYLMVNRPAHWQALAQWIHEVTGNEEVRLPMFEGPSSARQEYRDLLDIYINDMTTTMTVDHVYHEGQRRHIAFTPLARPVDVTRSAQLAARDYFVEVEHATVGRLQLPGAPYRHEKTPWRLERAAPCVGEHNREVYQGELGMSPDRFDALCDARVI